MPARTLDDALQDNAQLLRAYRIAKRAERTMLCADPLHGDRLHKFIQRLNHFNAEHGDRMVEYVEGECLRWLGDAPVEIRYAALQACGEREQKVRVKAGLVPFDDPVPGEVDNVFRLCKKVMGL